MADSFSARASARLPNFTSCLLLFLLATNYFVPFADLDFTWQIRTGQQILHTGSLRPVDTFTYTIAGTQVPEFEWLYEVVLAVVWNLFGYGGLKLLKTVLVAAPYVILARRLKGEGVRWHGVALSVGAAIVLLMPAWNLRPLYCTTIGLLLVSGWLHDHCNGKKPLTAWLIPVMLVWANAHPGVIAGQGLLAGAIGWEWVNRWWKLNRPLDWAGCWRLTVIGGLGLAATFVSPDPVERIVYPFRPEVAHPIQRIFVEMQPLYKFLWQEPYTAWFVYGIALAVAATVVVRFRAYRLWEIAYLLGLAGLANLAVRSMQDWVLNLLALGVPHLAVVLADRRRAAIVRARTAEAGATRQRLGGVGALVRVEQWCKRVLASKALGFQPVWPAALVLGLALVSLVPTTGQRMPIQEARNWPTGALDWAEQHGLSGRFFGCPDYGSYVTWRLRDRARCYVDTRGFFFPGELIADSHYVPQLGPEWETRLGRVLDQGTDYFLLETTGARGELWRTLAPFIAQPLYLDDQSVLLSADQVRTGVARLRHCEIPSG